MNFLIFALIFINLNFIHSNLLCDNSNVVGNFKNGEVVTINDNNNPKDYLDIKFRSVLVDETNLAIFINVVYKSSASIDSLPSFESFIKQNVTEVNFKLKSQNSIYNCKYVTFNQSLGISYQIQNLQPLQTYTIDVGYTYFDQSTDRYLYFTQKDSYTVATCFSSPSKPYDLTTQVEKNCDIKLQWKAPTTINAPSLCYYILNIRNSTGRVLNQTVYEPSYLFKNVKLDSSYTISIDAINDVSCYNNNDPSSKNCTRKTLGSGDYTISFQTPQKCKPNAANISLFSMFNIFICLSFLFILN